jgi:antitoxin VapB
MALSIKNKETERLARQLAKRTGESITQAVTVALHERLRRQRVGQTRLWKEVQEIQKRVAALPALDDRTADEILGFDEHGLFGN